MRRARATIPRFRPRRFATCAAQVLSQEARPRFIMTVAAWQRARRRFASPARVIPPVTSRSPDWLREGVRPTQGPTFLDEENRGGSSMAERKVRATTAPKPGMVMSRQQTGSLRQQPDLALEPGQFLAQTRPCSEHGIRCGFEHGEPGF